MLQMSRRYLCAFLCFFSILSHGSDVYFRESQVEISLPDEFVFNAHSAIDESAAKFLSNDFNISTARVFVGGIDECELCGSKKYLSKYGEKQGVFIEVHVISRGREKDSDIKVSVIYDSYYYVEFFNDLNENAIEYWKSRIRKSGNRNNGDVPH